jgi:molecular chaperone GrpE
MNDEHSPQQPDTAALSPDLAACTAQLAEVTRRYTYLSADFDTYRRRVERERAQWIAESEARVLRIVLAVVDDFERAYGDLQTVSRVEDLASRIKGFELVHKSIQKLLTDCGVEEIDTAGLFDPEKHEAILQVADASKEAGAIVAVLQKGYIHRGIVLRPARVSVAA